MYDELVKRLRDMAMLVQEYNGTGAVEDEAADAIEKLSAYTELYKDLAGKNQQMARKLIEEKPRWIPVTERLPKEADGMVFVLMPDVFPYNSKQPFVNCNQDRRIDMAHYSEHSKTWYFGDCGAVRGQEPIAWIHRNALPQPPKEET